MRKAAPTFPVEMNHINCDFAAAMALRRFDNPFDPDEAEDTGWIFDFPYLIDPSNNERITPAKVYMKFKIDPSKGDDYVDSNGRGNWQFVNGHKMHMYIAGVKLYGESGSTEFNDGTEIIDTPNNLYQYAFMKDQRGSTETPTSNTVDRITTGMGETPQAYVKGGVDLEKVAIIWVDADDLAQWEE
ncbi:MAG: hypothetical protein EOO88_45740 [Pedobacter sp.]|nr:MAG: hypothetical protein EOO88_45740 [Pedobacter sp.]